MKTKGLDEIYKTMSAEDIPWNISTPPEILVNLVNKKMISPCKTIDFGCGTGNYAIYFASRGFDVTGIDGSPTAIQLALEKVESRGLKCRFYAADVTEKMDWLHEKFGFVYDWGVLHHIHPKSRTKYVKNVHRLLEPAGKYLSVSFSEDDPFFGGKGKVRKTPLGTELYFSSEDELEELFSPYFEILHIKNTEIYGKDGDHRAICAWMEKSED